MDDIEHAEYMSTIKKHIDVAKAALQSIADMTAGIDKTVGMMAVLHIDAVATQEVEVADTLPDMIITNMAKAATVLMTASSTSWNV